MRKKSVSGLVYKFVSATICFVCSQAQAVQKVKLLCGAIERNGAPYAVLDFELRKSKGRGASSDKYPQVVSPEKYPIEDYRLLNVPGHRFRLGAEVFEETQKPRQHFVALSIYEESENKLLQRYSTSLRFESLQDPVRFSYELPQNKGQISCHISLINDRPLSSVSKKK